MKTKYIPKIIIISDIHVTDNVKFEKKKKYQIPFEQYLNELRSSLIKDVEDATHLIINGDISFSGAKKEYEIFNDVFLEPLKKINNELAVITVFGNHDIHRENLGKKENNELVFDEEKSANLENNKQSLYKDLNLDDRFNFEKSLNYNIIKLKKKDDSDSYTNDLLDLSYSYRKFYKDNIDRIFDKNKNRWEEYGYRKSQGLVGIVWDKKYNIIFNILNSSWFAFGDEILFNAIMGLKDWGNDIKENIKKIKNELLEGNLREMGNLEYLTIKNADYHLNNLEDYLKYNTVLTLSHHPLHYCKDKYTSEMENIISKTDFLITGHEHNKPVYSSIYRGMCYHLECPQLFDFRYPKFNNRTDFNKYIRDDNNPGYITLKIYNEDNVVLDYIEFEYKEKDKSTNEFITKPPQKNNLSLTELKITYEEKKENKKSFLITVLEDFDKNSLEEFFKNFFGKGLDEIDDMVRDKWNNKSNSSILYHYLSRKIFKLFKTSGKDMTIALQNYFDEKKEEITGVKELCIVIPDFNLLKYYDSININNSNNGGLNRYISSFEKEILRLKQHIFDNNRNSGMDFALTYKVELFDEYRHNF